MDRQKKIKLVIIGHVDHGKSSILGRLLYETNTIFPDKMEEVKKVSTKLGKEFEFAFLLDHLQEEREQGITIDTTQIYFKTQARDFIVIDTPGHVEFIKNMVTGASQADAALLVIDAKEKIQEQTKRHAFILSFIGIKQVIVLVNKMDLVAYNEKYFSEIENTAREFLTKLKLFPEAIIPLSVKEGENIASPSQKMPWYKGQPLLTILNSFKLEHHQEVNSIIFPVQDVYRTTDKRISVGRLENGVLNKNDEVIIYPSQVKTRVNTIESHPQEKTVAVAGECLGLTFSDPVFIERGCVVGKDEGLLHITQSIKATVLWISNNDLLLKEKLKLKCSTQEIACTIKSIGYRVDSHTLETLEQEATVLKKLEVGEVHILLKHPVVMTRFQDFQPLGRIVLIKDKEICASGIVQEINHEP